MTGLDLAFLFLLGSAPNAAVAQWAMQGARAPIVIRVPATPRRRGRGGQGAGPRRLWRERPASECQSADQIMRARFTRRGAVDFIMRDRSLIRARLAGECLSLGYYSAFYLVPGDDGRICVGRDMIVSREGGQCAIATFRRLVPRDGR